MSGCCGEVATGPLNAAHRMRIRYLGGRSIEVTGPVTRQLYRFSGKEREQLVDPRDGVSIVSSRAFQLVGLETVSSKELDHG